jgi:two-component system chemotaxis response regulator CheY
MACKRVLSLGQCGADHAAISWTFRSNLDADVVAAGTPEEAEAQLRDEDFDLVLVNRVLDWTGALGVDFIRQLKADPGLKELPVMLVSNYDDAQREAVAAGALPGFGKRALRSPQTVDMLQKVLGQKEPIQAAEEGREGS